VVQVEITTCHPPGGELKLKGVHVIVKVSHHDIVYEAEGATKFLRCSIMISTDAFFPFIGSHPTLVLTFSLLAPIMPSPASSPNVLLKPSRTTFLASQDDSGVASISKG
jgi:hypothetical protein